MDVSTIVSALALVLSAVAIALERMAAVKNQERENRLSEIEEARREEEVRSLDLSWVNPALVEQDGQFYWRLEAISVDYGLTSIEFWAYEYEPGDPPDLDNHWPGTPGGHLHHNPEEVPGHLGPSDVGYVQAEIDPSKAYVVITKWRHTPTRKGDEGLGGPRAMLWRVRPVPFH